MGVVIGSIVLKVADRQQATAFWSAALGYQARASNPDFLAPVDFTTGGERPGQSERAHLHVDEADEVHLDLWVDEGSTLEGEVERLVALGANRVEWTYADDAQHVVLADPDGNLFCVCA